MTIKLYRPYPAELVLQGNPKPIKDWREKYKVYIEGAEYSKAFKRGWDGYIRPGKASFSRKTFTYTLKLSRGWLSEIKKAFPSVEVKQSYETSCTLDIGSLKELEEWERLRDYQKESIRLLKEHKWGKISLATNAGKGAIFAMVALAALPSRTLILADEVAVFDALVGEIEKWTKTKPGLVESGCDQPPKDNIVVGMVPTIRERLKGEEEAAVWMDWLESFPVALLDEADKATANSWEMVCEGLVNTEYRGGFSGSFPEEGSQDAFNLTGLLGDTLITVKNKALINRGISAKPFVQLVPYKPSWIPKIPEPEEGEEVPSGPEKRRWVYQHAVIENKERHALIKKLLHPNEPNAIIVNRIEHGERLAEYLPDTIFLSGSDSKSYRRDVLEQFRKGEFQNLIATRILDRGTNLLGNTVGLIFASAAGSSRQTLQRIGRGLRKGDDKEFLFLRDVMDRGHRYLEKASRQRLKVYQKEKFDIEFYEQAENVEN